jgi:toxin ParE1/3/4
LKRLPVVYLPSAGKDLTDIFDYIKIDRPSAARRLMERLDRAASRLGLFPLSGIVPRDERLKTRKYRFIAVGDYLLFYVVEKNAVEIRRVVQGKRRYRHLLP